MEADFWLERWEDGRTAFHQTRVNKRLETFWPALGIDEDAPVFVPLCGKSLDMVWLHERGHPVFGVELSERAVRGFFSEHAYPHERRETRLGVEYLGGAEASGIHLVAGDFFALEPRDCEHVQGFYDRASLIAMNGDLRADYARRLIELIPLGCSGLLISIDYDESKMKGPPFAVSDALVKELLGPGFEIEVLEHGSGPERLGDLAGRGLDTLDEYIYRLTRVPLRAGAPAQEPHS